MAITRAARLAPVVEMAENAERKAAQRVGVFQGHVNQAENKLAELDRYRQGYQQQWMERGNSVSGMYLINYQRFLNQIESAAAQQLKSLQWHQTNLRNARASWQKAYARVEGLRKLVERYRQEAQRLEDKREQRLLDELSQRLPRHSQY